MRAPPDHGGRHVQPGRIAARWCRDGAAGGLKERTVRETLALFRKRNVAYLWAARFVSHLGDWILMIALPVWVYQLTSSAAILGFMVAVQTLPIICLGPLAGVFVDRWDRRRVITVGYLVQGINVLLLFLVTTPQRVYLVFLVGFVETAASTFAGPARRALLPNLVAEQELVAANALFNVAFILPRLVGPALGAALIAWAGPTPAFAVDAATFAFAALAVAGMRVPRASTQPGAPTPVGQGLGGVYQDLIAGVRVIRSRRVLLVVLGVWALLMFAAGPVVSLLVVFVQEALGGSAASYGLLESLLALGMLAGFALAGSLSGWPALRLFKVGLVTFAPLFLLVANAPNVYWAGVILPVTGMTMAAIMVADETILQQATEDAFRGRVLTVNEAVVSSMGLISAALAGVLMDRVGVRLIFNAAGVVCVVAALLGLICLRETGASEVNLGSVEVEPS
ncbi:MAG: MFS transporter [Chloroflexi bacterium]|nr:MAG: MFS transporter [Chloroflexota bacterium]